MRLRKLFVALAVAIAFSSAGLSPAEAAGPLGYCPPSIVGNQATEGLSKSHAGMPTALPRVPIGDPLMAITPVVQYACSNSCRRGCQRAYQSCRGSTRTCQRRLSACIRRCGC